MKAVVMKPFMYKNYVVYEQFYKLDYITGTINNHFQSNRGVLTDLSLLSYSRFKNATKINHFLQYIFLYIEMIFGNKCGELTV